MAMALSSTMAPTGLGPHRRLRTPPPSTNTNNSNDQDDNMLKDKPRSGVRFAGFDAALCDSDQTISGFNGMRMWGRRPRDPPFNVTRQRSSFFPDSTDDEDMTPVRRMPLSETTREHKGTSAVPPPTFPVIHIGDVQFPTTRTVLWDRRVLAGPFEVQTVDVLPRIRITNRLLKELYAQVVDTTNFSSSRLLGFATTDESTPHEDGWVTLSTLVDHKPEGGKQSLWSVPFHSAKPAHQEDEATERSRREDAARRRYETTSGSRPRGGAIPVEARGFIYKSEERNHVEIDVELDVVVPVTQLHFQLVRSLPLLMNPLAASMLRCEFGSEIQRFGYLTLDRARKAVPLLETDPLVLQRPIVGLWVYGINVDDATSADVVHVNHPYLFEACVRFLTSKIIKERALVDTDTFLVAIYPGNTAGWRSAVARTRCLAGISSFTKDLEVDLVLTPEDSLPAVSSDTKDSYEIPPRQPSMARERHQPSRVSQRVVVQHLRHQSEAHEDIVPGNTQHDEPSESDSRRSCCREQRVLSAQLQQTLDNQQKQLRELQEQITRLERALAESQAEKARLLSAGVLPSPTTSHVDTHTNHEHDAKDLDPRNDPPSTSFTAVRQPDGVDEQSQDHDNDENDISMVSSLALSSVSSDSNPSELSSVSSSLVGTRLKSLLTSEPTVENESEEQDAKQKQAGSPREPQAVGEVNNQDDSPTLGGVAMGEDSDDAASDKEEDIVRRSCPHVPSSKRLGRRAQCERDEFEEESDASKIDELLAERLHIPDTPNREEIVRGGALPTFGFSHGSSFSIPKIKYVAEIVTCDSDDDEEEIRRIELKYRKRRVH